MLKKFADATRDTRRSYGIEIMIVIILKIIALYIIWTICFAPERPHAEINTKKLAKHFLHFSS